MRAISKKLRFAKGPNRAVVFLSSLVPAIEKDLKIPRPHWNDKEPPPFKIEGELVRRWNIVYDRANGSFRDSLEWNGGCIFGFEKSGCAIGCAILLWPLGLLWLSIALVVLIYTSIQWKARYRYVCTWPEYQLWVSDTDFRHQHFERENKEHRARAAAKRIETESAKIAAKLETERQEQMALAKVRKQRQERIALCRFDNWSQLPTERFAFVLPAEWWPLKLVGVAYTSVVPFSSLNAEQQYRLFRWETVGKQPEAKRGVFLIGTDEMPTLNVQPLIALPEILPGTDNKDLVVFAVDVGGRVRYLKNPVRHEQYIDPENDDEIREKLELLAPFLVALRQRALESDDESQGWI